MIFGKIIEKISTQRILEEGSSVYKKGKITISVYPSSMRTYGNDAYFKFTRGSNPEEDPTARIKFKKAEYVTHYKGSKQNIKLKSNEKEELMQILNSQCENRKYIGYTVWQALIIEFNKLATKDDKLNENLPIPDYTKL